jgi:hypothetical protein
MIWMQGCNSPYFCVLKSGRPFQDDLFFYNKKSRLVTGGLNNIIEIR